MWVFGTTAVIVVLPLILSLELEKVQIETERAVVKDLMDQGFNMQQIQQAGFTPPTEPAVLTR